MASDTDDPTSMNSDDPDSSLSESVSLGSTSTSEKESASSVNENISSADTSSSTSSLYDRSEGEDEEWHLLPLSEVSRLLGTGLNLEDLKVSRGLSHDAVLAKQLAGQTNTLTPPPKTPEILKFLWKFTDFLMVLEIAAAIMCFIVYPLSGDVNNLYIAILLCILVFFTCLFSYLQERQSDKVMESFGNMMATEAMVIRDGEQVSISAATIVPGDLLVLRAGDKVPADVRLVSVDGLQVDNSAMTGESEAVVLVPNATSDEAAHSRNLAWSSALAVDGKALGIVTAVGDKTMIGRVAKLAGATDQTKSILELEILHFVRVSTAISLVLAVILVIVGLTRNFATLSVIVAALSILLANVPQGLPPAITSVLAITAEALRLRNVYVKRLDIVESLGSCTVIASDKTGTLTLNKMTALHMWPSRAPRERLAMTVEDAAASQVPSSWRHLTRVLVLCNRVVVSPNVRSLHGLDDRAFKADASEIGLFKLAFNQPAYRALRAAYPVVAEIPFNSIHKWQLSCHECPENEESEYPLSAVPGDKGAYLVQIKGAPEIILELSGFFYKAGGEVSPCTTAYRESVKATIMKYANDGERVLGFAEAYISAEQKEELELTRELPKNLIRRLRFAGLCTLLDPPKEGVARAVAQCQTAGIQVIMITGDFPGTAAAIAKQVGIFSDTADPSEQAVYTGADCLRIGDDTAGWDAVLSKKRLVFARMLPENKLTIVEQLQRRGEVVAVTGDGVNDSPALKRANVGIAMGIAGTEVAKEAAKIVCADDNFASIVEGIRYGRIIFDNLRKIIMLIVTHLIPEAWPFILTYFVSIPLGLSSLLLLTIDLGTEMLPSIALAYEGPEADVMMLPPRSLKTDRLVSTFSLSHAYLEVGQLESILILGQYLLMFAYYKVPLNLLHKFGTAYFIEGAPDIMLTDGTAMPATSQIHVLRQIQTMWFVSIATCQFFHVFAIRTVRQPFWTTANNWRLNVAVLISIGLLFFIVFTPPIQKVFGSEPFPGEFWGLILASGLIILIYVELKKLILRRCYRHESSSSSSSPSSSSSSSS